MKSRFLVVCLPLCGVVGCVGERSRLDGAEPSGHTSDAGASTLDSANVDAAVGATDADSRTNTPAPHTHPGAESSGDGGLSVGDRIDGEVVVGISTDNYDCTTVELEAAEAAFECSEAQLAALAAGPSDAALEAVPSKDDGALATISCDELAERQRSALRHSAGARLERNYLRRLGEYCLPQIRRLYFVDGERVDGCYGYGNADAGVAEPPPPDDGASEYSTTNTQVEGVDEADYVKNDGNTIYVLSEQSLVVFDAWPVETLVEIARLELPAEPRRMFLAEDRLVVYLRAGGNEWDGTPCTYGYACRSSSESGSTWVQVYDVTEPALPVLLKEYQFSGAYLASRRIGNAVFSVVHDGPHAEPPEVDVSLDALSPDELEQQFGKRASEIAAVLDAIPTAELLSWVIEKEPGKAAVTVPTCDGALAASAARGTSFVSVIGFDLETLAAPTMTLVGSKPGFVYASSRSLYLAVDGVDGRDDTFTLPWSHGAAEDDQTTVHKFELEGIGASYHGSKVIPGHVLNQFSMDEHEDVLRVATTNGWAGYGASSNVVTLGEQGAEFAVLGELRGLAPSEDIRSVRFDGERGFVVTFKETDPLFVIGLSDPKHPALLGELEIPGFSTYMHLLDAHHLLAVGFDAEDDGGSSFITGIQAQIFDITEPTEPKLQHKTVLGTRSSSSHALMNHLAFNYFPSRQVLALPVTICERAEDAYRDEFQFAGLVVYDVSLESGLTERGRLPFATAADVDPLSSLGSRDCDGWWVNASSRVERSIFLEDYAIGLSVDWLKAAALSDLGTVLRSVPLSEAAVLEANGDPP